MLVWHGTDEVMHHQWGRTQCQGHQQGFYDLITQLGIPRPAYVSYAVLLPWGSHTATQNCSAVPVCGTLGSFDTRVHQCVCRSCLTSVWCHPRRCRCSVSDQPMLGCWLIQVLLLQVLSLCDYLFAFTPITSLRLARNPLPLFQSISAIITHMGRQVM